jgi:hypothetical protein
VRLGKLNPTGKRRGQGIVQFLLFLAAASILAYCAAGGVLEDIKVIQVDPTVIAQPEKVKETVAANLVRYDLRAALRDALFEEGASPIRAHLVLDEFSSPGTAKRVMNVGTGRTLRTVEGRLVITDASGKELANIPIHFHGSVALNPGTETNAQGRRATSDFEQRLLDEIERLK